MDETEGLNSSMGIQKTTKPITVKGQFLQLWDGRTIENKLTIVKKNHSLYM